MGRAGPPPRPRRHLRPRARNPEAVRRRGESAGTWPLPAPAVRRGRHGPERDDARLSLDLGVPFLPPDPPPSSPSPPPVAAARGLLRAARCLRGRGGAGKGRGCEGAAGRGPCGRWVARCELPSVSGGRAGGCIPRRAGGVLFAGGWSYSCRVRFVFIGSFESCAALGEL